MTQSAKNPKVDAWLRQTQEWPAETKKLRALALRCGLVEEWKWSKPCYSFEGRNLVIIIGFKESCALAFCQGSLLKDAQGMLSQPGENSQAMRWIKFTSVREIVEREAMLEAYIREAIAAEKAGLKVKYKQPADLKLPEELQRRMKELPALQTAFAGLTPGRRRAYVLFISGAKQSATREARIEKHLRRMLAGKGLND
ncbi:MAG TPA: YdeI/OmpD-associated family protein [Opitutaceae bacterium]|jgi:uncharacterized protein YdeI (YjbR/CyaY-like superfamily)|nr:YdeI/OmpD-associated family protein [Opitutaceae bacterium]